jgi:hypothetical protein
VYQLEYWITGGELTTSSINPELNVLSSSVKAAYDGNLVIKIPRQVLDSKFSSNQNSDFVVFVDEIEVIIIIITISFILSFFTYSPISSLCVRRSTSRIFFSMNCGVNALDANIALTRPAADAKG